MIAIALSKFLVEGSTSLYSRSLARRVISAFENGTQVTLDYQGVSLCSPSFLDEIYRVYAKGNPWVSIVSVNAVQYVAVWIRRICPESCVG